MPPVLAGREPVLNAFETVRKVAQTYGEGERSWILTGLRGVGKTVLLGELLKTAEHHHWITAKVEASTGTPLAVSLAGSLQRALRTATGRHPVPKLERLLGVFKSFWLKTNGSSVALGADVDLIAGIADTGRFDDDLAALFELLGETSLDLGVGTLVLIDELQEAAASDLKAVNTAVHAINQGANPLPVIVVGAGLPSLPAALAEANSYAERLFEFRPIGLLDETAAREALVAPAAKRGVGWTEEGINLALAEAGGYPYFLQAIGKHVWDQAANNPISADDVRAGLSTARAEVDAGLYASRWDRATPAQRSLLRAMAEVGGEEPSAISDLVIATGKSRVSDLSVARNEIIKKGLAFSPERGLLAFTVPGMADYVHRQP